MRTSDPQRDQQIADAYASRQFMTTHIAQTFGVSVRRVQQIVKDRGLVRTRAEGNAVSAPLKSRHRIFRRTR